MFAIAGRRNTQFCDLRPFRKNNCFVRACAEKSTPAVVTKFVRGSVGQCLILELVCKGKFWLFRSKSFFSGASGQEEIMDFCSNNMFFKKSKLRKSIFKKPKQNPFFKTRSFFFKKNQFFIIPFLTISNYCRQNSVLEFSNDNLAPADASNHRAAHSAAQHSKQPLQPNSPASKQPSTHRHPHNNQQPHRQPHTQQHEFCYFMPSKL